MIKMPFNLFERTLSWRYLRARRKEGFVSVITTFSLLGICLGVATLIIVMSVMNGFREELLSQILGINGHLTIYAKRGAPLTDYEGLAERVKGIEGISMVIPTIQGQVMFSFRGKSEGGLVRGVDPAILEKREMLTKNQAGKPLSQLGNGGVLVGEKLLDNLNARLGDQITIISPKGVVTAFGTIPRIRAFEASSTFNVGMFEYDSGFVFMSLPAAQTYFGMPREVSHLEIFVTPDNIAHVEEIKERIIGQIGTDYNLVTWEDQHASFFNAIQVERNVMFLILTLIILVAAFNIISGLIMLVKDKGKDIAILRTMGATRHSIMRIFFMSGAFIGVVGTLSGLILGLLFCHYIENIRQLLQQLMGANLFSEEIYFLSKLPAIVDPMEVLVVGIMSLTLSLGATLYPAWRAAKLDPVEALRYE